MPLNSPLSPLKPRDRSACSLPPCGRRSPSATGGPSALSRPVLDVSCAHKNVDVLLLAADALKWESCKSSHPMRLVSFRSVSGSFEAQRTGRRCPPELGSADRIVWVLMRDDLMEQLRLLRPEDRLSHIPGMSEVCNKATLSEALQARNAAFWPRAWRTPPEPAAKIWREAIENGGCTLIVKPACGSQGQGISLARSQQELQRAFRRLPDAGAIVQEYVDQPLLLDSHKWDARIYALVMPSDRVGGGLQCFLAREGLVRVCLDPYERADARNLHRQSMHLTNYSLSKFSDNFVFNSDPARADHGCKRTLSAVLGRLEQAADPPRVSAESMWQTLAILTRQTVNAVTAPLRNAAADPAMWDGDAAWTDMAMKKSHQCFHIIGLDFLLDSTGRAWLLEMNNNPSFSIDEVRPLQGVRSRAEANQIFADARREKGTSKWGRPCRCQSHPRPHAHHQSAIDVAVKQPVIEGALTIVRRAQQSAGHDTANAGAAFAEGTIFMQV